MTTEERLLCIIGGYRDDMPPEAVKALQELARDMGTPTERAQIVSWLEAHPWQLARADWYAAEIKAGKHLSEPTPPPTGEVE